MSGRNRFGRLVFPLAALPALALAVRGGVLERSRRELTGEVRRSR